ncbi:hypothetical protein EFL79_10245 [Weissella confusa]|nr:hypothetical protein [Weissella confusa]
MRFWHMKYYSSKVDELNNVSKTFSSLPDGHRTFFWGGHTSDEFGVHIQNSFDFISPEVDVTFIEVPGRSGSVAIPKKRYKSVTKTLPVTIVSENGRIEDAIQNVDEWLKGTYIGSDYLWSREPNVFYEAYIASEFTYTRLSQYYATANITFKFEPYRYLISGLTAQNVTNGAVINNPTKTASFPAITLMGNGNATITINNGDNKQVMQLLNVDGGIYLDSKTMQAISTKTNDNSMFRLKSLPFLKLLPGDNRITWTIQGTSSMTIRPNWEELI